MVNKPEPREIGSLDEGVDQVEFSSAKAQPDRRRWLSVPELFLLTAASVLCKHQAVSVPRQQVKKPDS